MFDWKMRGVLEVQLEQQYFQNPDLGEWLMFQEQRKRVRQRIEEAMYSFELRCEAAVWLIFGSLQQLKSAAVESSKCLK